MKRILLAALLCASTYCTAQETTSDLKKYEPYVNQLGYNLGESKRFVCYGAENGTPFQLINTATSKVVFEGEMLNNEGWFSGFNPTGSNVEYVIKVDGYGSSVPFLVADHLMETASSKLAYDFFVDARGFSNLETYDMAAVYGGGPTRDGGAYGLETIFEILQYASNPALFDNWKTELGNKKVADLIDLILWHAEFAYKYVDYNGPVKTRHGTLGYQGQPRMTYDYWNTLDQLAAVCAAYHSFLKPYLAEDTYQKYRKACLDNWEAYDRHKVVRFWTYSTKWVDEGFQEFNEMGNAYGQSVFRNLFMYETERHEKNGSPEKFLKYAQSGASDIIRNWDFNNPRHMWWIRNAEHITPQALSFFLLLAPDKAPDGTLEKLEAWALHMKQKSNNFWKYRKHSETEWAHPKTKELGGAPALGGSMFAIAHLLKDPELRALGWAQTDFVFGVNPVGTHLSNKSDARVKIDGYWDGVEKGWPQSHPHGYGELGKVRGTLDGSPLDSQFPIAEKVEAIEGKNEGRVFGKNAYATEGWGISNRGWQATLTFSTLGSHKLKVFDGNFNKEISSVEPGQTITIQLNAALNIDRNAIDKGWVLLKKGEKVEKIQLTETDVNTGKFTSTFKIPKNTQVKFLELSYGFLGFEKKLKLEVKQ
ncbi:cellulase N-terminal Ig-like domain-containing protein [Zobellia sp. 1_MG-2023]|uniref:cellulase N-terminal Ig-like domain-containing protein n=1 Tax=Zobellia sp. 1_MG-2023 TaxID=3062626 RepID=UPI0026E3CBFE|nr:cellulase N-terminal Ig-like domain-containing protein [Zobellia sp. 1_MG-2023]MDO6819556.1 cellulase N-terminal Ig-like domain-containing protein [Zobellia sp. 1_MG-2023]